MRIEEEEEEEEKNILQLCTFDYEWEMLDRINRERLSLVSVCN